MNRCFAPQSLLQSAFIVTVMYGFVSALLLALRRWIERRQAYTSRAVAREEGAQANLAQALESVQPGRNPL